MQYGTCKKHGTPTRLEYAERGKTIEVCDTCRREMLKALDHIPTVSVEDAMGIRKPNVKAEDRT